jgi:hypothetical protein
VPWGPSNFDRSAPGWAVTRIELHAERIVKRPMTATQVVTRYHPGVRRRDGFVARLHTKVSAEGHSAIRCWYTAGAVRELPSEWMHTFSLFKFRVSHLWMMECGFGFAINTTDAQVLSEAPDVDLERLCPFLANRTEALNAFPSMTNSGKS